MVRKPREATSAQKEILVQMGIVSPNKAEDLFLGEASHLIQVSLVTKKLKDVRDAAKDLNEGSDVEYDGVVCKVVAVRQLHPKGVNCNMNNITIQLPNGKKKTVRANSLTKV